MRSIQILPPSLVNKIAAGEVIERPASVVKELVENALDAGAARVEITLEDGGKKLIRVVDDGQGIRPEDVPLAVAAHATSKLRDEQDLYRIATLGFRGEALASIGSVAHLRLASRCRDADAGCEITVIGQQTSAPRPIAHPPGTTVEVRNLFFNVPARRKFLRTTSTELAHITEQLARVAIAHPGVAFQLTHEGRVLHRLPTTDSPRSRIGDFFGRQLADALVPVCRQQPDLAIEGFVAPPAQSRATGRWQYTFLNGRYIRDRYIQHAVREAYRGLLEPDRFAVVFLFLRVPPELVDVNVHPTKIEVRWRDANVVHAEVLAALRDTFLQSDLATPLRTPDRTDPAAEERRRQTRQAIAEYFKRLDPMQQRLAFPPDAAARAPHAPPTGPVEPAGPKQAGSTLPTGRPSAAQPSRPGGTPPPADVAGSIQAGRPSAPDTPTEPAQPERPKAIQLHNTYLVAETPEGMIIVDQHALHERILYEQLRERLERGPLESQRLLLPETVPVTAQQLAALETHAELLARLGLEITPFGPETVAVHAVPTILEDLEAGGFVRDLLDKLVEQAGASRPEAFIHEVLDLMACKAAIKAGSPLDPQEIEALLAQRHLVERSSRCPHGRPTMLRFSIRDLEKQFKRT